MKSKQIAIFFGLLVLFFTLQTKSLGQDEIVLESSDEFILSDEAKAAKIEGKVKLLVKIDKLGIVKKAEMLGGFTWPCGTRPKKELADVANAIIANVEASKFKPYLKNGKPKEVEFLLTFSLYPVTAKSPDGAGNGKKILKSGVLNGKALSLPKPPYPEAARENRISGAVQIAVLIDEDGKVVSAGAIEGHPVFFEDSREAACGAKFSPTTLEGKALKVSGIITYNFSP